MEDETRQPPDCTVNSTSIEVERVYGSLLTFTTRIIPVVDGWINRTTKMDRFEETRHCSISFSLSEDDVVAWFANSYR